MVTGIEGKDFTCNNNSRVQESLYTRLAHKIADVINVAVNRYDHYVNEMVDCGLEAYI